MMLANIVIESVAHEYRLAANLPDMPLCARCAFKTTVTSHCHLSVNLTSAQQLGVLPYRSHLRWRPANSELNVGHWESPHRSCDKYCRRFTVLLNKTHFFLILLPA